MPGKAKILSLVLAVSFIASTGSGTCSDQTIDWTKVAGEIEASQPQGCSNEDAGRSSKQREAIYAELDKFRHADEQRLLAELVQQPANVQSFISQYAVSRKLKAAVPRLIQIYNSQDRASIQEVLVMSVANLAGESNRPFLLDASTAKNISARRAAVDALAVLPHDHETIPRLRILLLSDPAWTVRERAAWALGNFPNDQWAKQGLDQALGEEQGIIQAIKLSLVKIKNLNK